jgi:uncharacterized membrane protein
VRLKLQLVFYPHVEYSFFNTDPVIFVPLSFQARRLCVFFLNITTTRRFRTVISKNFCEGVRKTIGTIIGGKDMESMQEALQQAGVATGEDTAAQRGGGSSGQGADVNVGEIERWASAIGGGALAVYGVTRLLTRGSVGGAVLALVGGSLVYRGTTGHCNLYEAAGINTSGTETRNPVVSVSADRGIRVEKSITINKSPEELYRFWRNFENLPRFMNHLESVQTTGEGRSHWVAKAPAGSTVEWDAEVYNEKEGELIAWRSLDGADVDNAGSVRFEPAINGRGTTVRVTLRYDPPGGALGAAVARLFGENPEQQVEEDLRRFKQVMETGEVTTTEGQPSGRAARA